MFLLCSGHFLFVTYIRRFLLILLYHCDRTSIWLYLHVNLYMPTKIIWLPGWGPVIIVCLLRSFIFFKLNMFSKKYNLN